MENNSLFGLPDFIWYELFANWLCTKSLLRLDGAVTNRSMRHRYLDFISRNPLKIAIKQPIQVQCLHNWLVRRDVRPNILELKSKPTPEGLETLDWGPLADLQELRCWDGTAGTQAALVTMLPFTKQLRTLEVRNVNVRGYPPSLTRQTMLHLAKYCSQLTMLVLDVHVSEDSTFLFEVIRSCQSLKHLHLCDCALSMEDISMLAPTLTYFQLNNGAVSALLREEHILALLQRCPLLTTIYTSDCGHVHITTPLPPLLTDDLVTAIATSHTHITHLQIMTRRNTWTTLHPIIQHCQALQSLFLKDCTALTQAEFTLLLGMPKITRLYLQQNSTITGVNPAEIGSARSGLNEFTAEGFTAITDNGLSGLGTLCTQLQKISLCESGLLTSAGVVEFVRSCPSVQQVTLWISPLAQQKEVTEMLTAAGVQAPKKLYIS